MESMNSWHASFLLIFKQTLYLLTSLLHSHFFSDICQILNMWSTVDLFLLNPDWYRSIISFAYGVILVKSMFEKILFGIDKSEIPNILTRVVWKARSSAYNRRETLVKRLLGRDLDRSLCHLHTSLKLFWSQPIVPCTA